MISMWLALILSSGAPEDPPAPVDAMGVVRLLGKQQPDK